MWALLAGAAFVFTWGLIDDLRRIPSGVKLLLLAATGGIPLIFGLSFQAPGPVWGMLLAGLWVMGMTNAVNWLDNMDGIAAGTTTVAAATLFGLSILSANTLSETAALALGGSALGFLILNFPPAKIFMGDCGSGVLGYSLAVTALFVARATASPFPVPILVSAFVLGVPILDMMLVVSLRMLRRQSIFVGGRDHLAHRLVAWGFSEREVVALLYTLGLATGAIAVFTIQASGTAWAVAVILGTVPLAFVGVLGALARVDSQPVRLWSSLGQMRTRYGATVLQGSLVIFGLALLYYPVVDGLF